MEIIRALGVLLNLAECSVGGGEFAKTERGRGLYRQ
jgi:hypothetical protein